MEVVCPHCARRIDARTEHLGIQDKCPVCAGDITIHPVATSSQGNAIVGNFAEPLYRAKGWIKFAGAVSIVHGVLSIVSIYGIIICWVPIYMGLLLCSASDHIGRAYEIDSEDDFHVCMQKLKTYFRILGLLVSVTLLVVLAGLATLAIMKMSDL